MSTHVGSRKTLRTRCGLRIRSGTWWFEWRYRKDASCRKCKAKPTKRKGAK